MQNLTISDWKLIRLTVEELGPFRNGKREFDFFGIEPGSSDPYSAGPANLYMLLAKNAYGKTTVLEAIFGLFGLLNENPCGRFAQFTATGQAQVDIRATWTIDGVSQDVLLSVWTGSQGPVRSWTPDELDTVAQTRNWAGLGISMTPQGLSVSSQTNELGALFYDITRRSLGQPPSELFGLSQNLPSILYFPADRRVVAPVEHFAVTRPDIWGYQPAQIFSSDGPEWGTSIDNVLVWLEWLADRRSDGAGDRRVDDLLSFLNALIFKDDPSKSITQPRREELRTYVKTRYGVHSLAALSHGERAMLQILGRTLTHMTSNTIILIDEIEIHLHTRWMNRMFEAMKELLRNYTALTLIFTTHNRELMQVFQHNVQEEGLIKGGHLIESDIQ
ncbi:MULTISPECIES: AAA family ATPase [Rhizobium]|uniref:AAA family ATPase n=1 Tax=Rhizobium aouanii TaxID=3118145 RepID=A0ABU8CJT9_9HYPH|nr:AAA family ATPase [Rhizobium acaciae]MCW1410789.1 AAA family ATPase [Rhizobium acaciae]MCW1742912.1 AAA family ATPase [Rhizobium acaciae]MCW1750108.1 AAA family ATPase [Rhizobium acaciae]